MSATLSVSGAQRRRVPPAWLKTLQVVTGYALLRALGTLFGRFLLGYRVNSTLSWDGRHVLLKSETFLLGRSVRQSALTLLARDFVALGTERRYPQLLLLLGALGVLLGALVGIGWIIDGIEASYAGIGLVGLATLTAGVALDMGLHTLADYIGDRSSLLLTISTGKLGGGRHFRIVGVKHDQAEAFVAEMKSVSAAAAPTPTDAQSESAERTSSGA